MSEMEVEEYRQKREIMVEGRDVPKPVKSFANVGFPDLASDLAQITFDYPFRIPLYFKPKFRAIGCWGSISTSRSSISMSLSQGVNVAQLSRNCFQCCQAYLPGFFLS
ncbi:uncharacterized protein [Gossypium hirsutum]|uniref:Uncharacterized protein isoform X1 n=1 Tax=Gossypium hirsutum TaxID=3635 RepID=A0ABM2ZH04_GOSHI|nr:uncharacterized protein LOC107894721 isoform X1 [Gossypium hirsutum]